MLKAHFINVGKGCCTAIEFPSGRLGVVDVDDHQTFSVQTAKEVAHGLGMNTAIRFDYYWRSGRYVDAVSLVEKAYRESNRSLTEPIAYIKALGHRSVFRFVLTHPDMDHMSGIKRLNEELPYQNLWDTDNNKDMSTEDWDRSGYRKEDWDTYQILRKSEETPKALCLLRGASAEYYADDQIEILSPTEDIVSQANDTEDYNLLSYVLRISYQDKSIIMGGDASTEAWDDILATYGDKLKCNVLFAPHHGSKNNFHKEAVEAMAPELVVVSVATGTDYAYQQYKRVADTVLSTKWCGNIVVTIDWFGTVSCDTQYP